jgi:hypothetical protein
VESGGGVAQQYVAWLDGVAMKGSVFFDYTDDGTGQIVRSRLVQSRHLRRLSACQDHSMGAAPSGDTFHNASCLLDPKPRTGDVIHERDRGGPVNQDVVHAVIDEILPDRLEPLRL